MIWGGVLIIALLVALWYSTVRARQEEERQSKPLTNMALAERALARVRMDAARAGRLEAVQTIQRLEIVLRSIKRRDLHPGDPSRL